MQDLSALLTPQRQAHIFACGFTAIVALGTLALGAICLAGLWLVIQFVLVLATSVIASCNELASAFAGADPMIKVLFLGALALVAYRVAPRLWRKA